MNESKRDEDKKGDSLAVPIVGPTNKKALARYEWWARYGCLGWGRVGQEDSMIMTHSDVDRGLIRPRCANTNSLETKK